MRTDLASALVNGDHAFTRDEVAVLMATAFRWGYERRVDEENGHWDVINTVVYFNAGETITLAERKRLREESDRLVREAYRRQLEGE